MISTGNYIDVENQKGNKCPILFVQQVLGAQGETTYKIKNDPINPQDIDLNNTLSPNPVDTTQNEYNPPYSRQLYMDNLANSIVTNLTMNEVTNIDKLELTKSILLKAQPKCTKTMDDIKPFELNGLTADPMLTNWGGPEFSTNLINNGYYSGNEIIKSTMTVSKI